MSRTRLISLLLALGTLAIYLPAVSHGFSLFDDNDYVTNNEAVQRGLSWAGVKWAFTTWHAGNWHPLTWLSHLLDCGLFGLNARPHHTVNVAFHSANAVLVFVLLFRLTGALWPAAFAAALFAWHPLHVESVAWIAERKDLLSTFFGLLALLAYTRFARGRWEPEGRISQPGFTAWTRGSASAYFQALGFYALSLLSKPMLVTLPFVMLLLDWWPLRRLPDPTSGGGRALVRLAGEKWPFFLFSAASCVITFLAQRAGGLVSSLESIPLLARLENVPLAYWRYLLKMMWPRDLAVFYPFPEGVSPLVVAAAMASLGVLSVAAWRARKAAPFWLAGWLFFLGTLVPVIGLVSIGGLAMADRYTYFPSIAVFLAVALGARDAVEWARVSSATTGAMAGAVLAACAALAEHQLGYWRDDVSLFSHAVEVGDRAGWAHFHHLGWLHLRLGVALEKEGRKDAAIAECRRAVEWEPNRAASHDKLATLLAQSGHAEEALAEFQRALRLAPDYASAHYNLGVLLLNLGRAEEAIEQCEVAARLNAADWHPVYLQAMALLGLDRSREAVACFRRVLQIAPDNTGVVVCLAQILASDANPQVRDGTAALALAEQAVARARGDDPAPLDVLSMAYAELGRFDAAQLAAQEALKLVQSQKLTNHESAILRQLELYKNHQPFRQSMANPSVQGKN